MLVNAPDVEPVPFARVLVPYDGSAQSDTALTSGIAWARRGAALDVLYVVDMSTVASGSSTVTGGIDPTPLIDALEVAGSRPHGRGGDASTTALSEAYCHRRAHGTRPDQLHRISACE